MYEGTNTDTTRPTNTFFATVISSAWCMLMLPMLYNSTNKEFFYTIDTLDDAGYKQAIRFSAVDFGLEAVTFGSMLLVFALHANLSVSSMGLEYVRLKKFFLPVLSVGFLVVISSFAFFVKHVGMDPDFQWNAFGGGGGGGANATNATLGV